MAHLSVFRIFRKSFPHFYNINEVMALSMDIVKALVFIEQGSHRLEKYLNIQDCLEKSLKIKFPLKST